MDYITLLMFKRGLPARGPVAVWCLLLKLFSPTPQADGVESFLKASQFYSSEQVA